MMKLTMNASTFAQMAEFVSRDETRYYLNGVYIHPAPKGRSGVIMVATDGHRLAVMHDANAVIEGGWPYSDGRGMIFARDKYQGASFRKADFHPKASEYGRRLVMTIEGDHKVKSARIVTGWNDDNPEGEVVAHAIMKLIDGAFPDYERILPGFDTSKPGAQGVIPAFNSVYLTAFGEVALRNENGAKLKHGAPVQILAEDASAPAWVLISGRDDFRGVLMPMRASHIDPQPTWLRPAPLQAVAAE